MIHFLLKNLHSYIKTDRSALKWNLNDGLPAIKRDDGWTCDKPSAVVIRNHPQLSAIIIRNYEGLLRDIRTFERSACAQSFGSPPIEITAPGGQYLLRSTYIPNHFHIFHVILGLNYAY